MKNLLFTLLLSAICVPLFSQKIVQNGLVRQFNSYKKPLGGVSIVFEGAKKKVSNEKDGTFRLVFEGKKAGEPMVMKEIYRRDFELVNQKEIESLVISNSDHLVLDIIMAPKGEIASAKIRYYDIAEKELTAGLERQNKALKDRVERAELNNEEYWKLYTNTQKQFELQKKQLDSLAWEFARTNFDDVSPIRREALELFQAGKINEAIAKIKSTDPEKRVGQILENEEKDKKAREELEKSEANTAKARAEETLVLRDLITYYSIQFNIDSAGIIYNLLVKLDGNNMETLKEASGFFRENHRYVDALRVDSLVVGHPAAKAWEVADAYRFLGIIHTEIGDLPAALNVFEKSQQIYSELWLSDSTSALYNVGLGWANQFLGITHNSLGNINEAHAFFEEMAKLFKELHESFPQNLDFKKGLAISYAKLGKTYSAMGKLPTALTFFIQFNQLTKELHESDPHNLDFKNGLAASCSDLGKTHSALGNLPTALTFFVQFNQLMKELHESYPHNLDFKKGLAISYQALGFTHSALDNMSTALTYFEQFNQLTKEMQEAYPQNVDIKKGLGWANQFLGKIHTSLGNMQEAKDYYEEMSRLFKELHESYPQNVEFKYGLAISYHCLGITHSALENLNEAKNFFEQTSSFFKELHDSYPQNVDFKNGLAYSHFLLADFYYEKQDNIPLALLHYQKADTLWTELVRDAPDNPEYPKQLAEVHSKLTGLGQAPHLPLTTLPPVPEDTVRTADKIPDKFAANLNLYIRSALDYDFDNLKGKAVEGIPGGYFALVPYSKVDHTLIRRNDAGKWCLEAQKNFTTYEPARRWYLAEAERLSTVQVINYRLVKISENSTNVGNTIRWEVQFPEGKATGIRMKLDLQTAGTKLFIGSLEISR